jgi:endonuclease III
MAKHILSKKKQQEILKTSIARWKKANPSPKCELYYRTPYQLLVSVVLSAQTTDKMVNKSMKEIYQQEFTPESAIKLQIKGIYQIIKSIGLANTKAKNIYNLSKQIIEIHSGQIPQTREQLEDLPGVGRKTANVILGELFQQPTLAVDTHVYRVSMRLGLHSEATPLKAEKILLQKIDPKHLPKLHHWFILHGRYTCLARKPKCATCCLNDICPSVQNF